MDIDEAKAHLESIENRIALAREYVVSRRKAAKAKFNLEIVLCGNLPRIREEKANIGYDMAILMLMSEGFLEDPLKTECRSYYKEWIEAEARYKGLERLMGAMESKTTFIQSMMRWQREEGG